jgi:hypothetical protein
MIEMAVGMVLGSVLMYFAFKFMTNTRHQYMHGSVNLQNLQEARLAINYLRRDFSSACPFLDPADADPKINVTLRKKPFDVSGWSAGIKSQLVKSSAQVLQFHRFIFNTEAGAVLSKVVEVEYKYDAPTKTLVRTSEGRQKSFKGLENVEFKLYLDDYNGRVPILWVKLMFHEGKDAAGTDKDLGRPLELTTSIVSPFMNGFYSHQMWNYYSAHAK